MMWAFRRLRSRDPVAFSEMIAANAPDRKYSALDRHREFGRLFEGGPEGRRVLAQILMRCLVWDRSHVPGDPYETARREGMRDVGLWIMEIVNAEPADVPQTAETEEGESHDSGPA